VLTDRYIFSIIVRGLVRGLNPDWVRNVFAFALIPDRIFYLKADIKSLVPRVLNARGFDYWESGLDFQHTRDYYNSYVRYQESLMERFDEVSEEFGFVHVDANRSIPEVFHNLQAGISELLVDMHAKAEQEEAKQKGKKKKGSKSNKS
jgi:dTMP kinase